MAKNLCDEPEFVRRLREQTRQVEQQHPRQTVTGGRARSLPRKRLRGGVALIPLPSNEKSLTIYKLEGCPYSEEAVRLASSRNLSNESVSVGGQSPVLSKEKVRDFLHRHTDFDKNKHLTFPIVFQGTTFLGGHDELVKKLDALSGSRHIGAGGRRLSRSGSKRLSKSRAHNKTISISRRRESVLMGSR